jgi:PAS domain S-box-containing protein
MSKTQSASETSRTQDQYISELAAARRRIAELEASEAERKQAEEALRVSEAHYRSVVESIGIGITLIGRDHRIILANAMQGRIFHKPASEFIGKNCFEEFEKRDAVCPHCPGVQAIATGRPAMVETTGIRDDRSVNFAQIQAFPVLNAAGMPTGFIEVVVDITERKLAEEAQRESEERFRLLVENLMPETRSELALPLISRGEAIGALTIQSSREAAFSEGDIAVLQTLAGQIANAIENTRLYKQTQAALEELEATHRLHVREAWGSYIRRHSSGE